MLLIANRGNLFGALPERENSPDFLDEAIAQGYHVMVDLWWYDHSFWFGTNHPTYKPMGGGKDWIKYSMNSLWLHARDPEALLRAIDLGVNVFWQQTDQYSVSSWGHLLGFYGVKSYGDSFVHVFPQYSFVVDNQHVERILDWCHTDYALCSDFVGTIVQHLSGTAVPADDPHAVSISSVA